MVRLASALAARYRIERELGAGGMATVYLAHDLKHDRLVAVKVLKPELAAVLGADRFVVEIKTTASMSHPHILPLFDSGSADGFLFYVMPYIDGETLRDKLDRETQLGIEDAVRIAREVLEALEYAHARGVIHRDIKPENILMQGGRPMIADFGIALAVSAAAGGRMTETGLSLGTPHYMSPEQATAEKEITGRADIYSLASVLYEMLTGEPPHMGNSAQQIIMKIITEQPQPVTRFRKSVPRNVADAVAKALEKLPADRFASAKTFSDALGNPAFAVVTGNDESNAAAGAHPRVRGASVRVRAGYWAIGAGVGALATAAAFVLLRAAPASPAVVRFELSTAPNVVLNLRSNDAAPFAISPDGTTIVFATLDTLGRLGELHRRRIGEISSTPIVGTLGAFAPFFSPDGRWIGFTTRDLTLRKVSLAGGPPITLATNVQAGEAGASWGDDGFIVYTSARRTMSRISSTGGVPELLSAPDANGGALHWPFVMPGGKTILFERCGSGQCLSTDLVSFDSRTKAMTVVVPGATRGWFLPTGELIYASREGVLYAVSFDATRGTVRGEASAVLDGIGKAAKYGYMLAVSASGAMIYLPEARSAGRQLVEADRTGKESVLHPDFADYNAPRYSPTRDRIAVARATGAGSQIVVYDVASRTLAQLTTEGSNIRPSWSADGSRVAFYSSRNDIQDLYWMAADRSTPAERVVDGDDTRNSSTTSWSRDGAWIVFDGIASDATFRDENIFAVGTGTDRKRKTLVATTANEETGEVSPDGKWLAYVSDEGGQNQVYVRPFMREGGRWLISDGVGSTALWASNSELVYGDVRRRQMMSVTLELGTSVRVTSRTALFSAVPYSEFRQGAADFDVSRDGQRFLMLREAVKPDERQAPIVTLHWADEIRRRIAEQSGSAR